MNGTNDVMQIGVMAYRDPKTREFVRSEPIYEKRTELNERAYDDMIRNAGKMLCAWIREDTEKKRSVVATSSVTA